MITCMTVFCPGVTKTNNRPKVKLKRFLKPPSYHPPVSSSNSSSPMNTNTIGTEPNEPASISKPSCNSTENLSHMGGGVQSALEEGFDSVEKSTGGVVKEKESSGEWASEMGKRAKGGWEKVRDDWSGQWVRGKGRKAQKKKSNLFDGSDEDKSPDFLPNKKRAYPKAYKKVNQVSSLYVQPDQKRRGTKNNLSLLTH